VCISGQIWLGLADPKACSESQTLAALISMNEVVFTGVSELGDDDKALLVAHVRNPDNHAKKASAKAKAEPAKTPDPVESKPGTSSPIPPAEVTSKFSRGWIPGVKVAPPPPSTDLVKPSTQAPRQQFVVPVVGKVPVTVFTVLCGCHPALSGVARTAPRPTCLPTRRVSSPAFSPSSVVVLA